MRIWPFLILSDCRELPLKAFELVPLRICVRFIALLKGCSGCRPAANSCLLNLASASRSSLRMIAMHSAVEAR